MKTEIKERISQIQNGIVPEGYKKTAVGIVPKEWEETLLSELFTFKNGLNKEKEAFGKGTPIINYTDVWKKRGIKASSIHGKVELSEKEIANYNVRKGDVFFTRTSETRDEIGLSSVLLDDIEDAVFSGFLLRARPINDRVETRYHQYCYSSPRMRHEIIRKSSITTRALTSGVSLGQVSINLPSKPEQEKIANILEKWDRAIELQEQLIEKLEVQRHGALQRIVSNNKWNKQSIGTFAKECKTRNENGKCKNVKSVSNKHGFISQNEQFSKTVASSDVSNYKIVKYKNIAYNPSRINVGSIAVYKESDEAIVSPMYVVFECCDIEPELLCLLLSTDKSKYNIIAYCTGSVRNSLNFDDLCKIKINLPDKKAQKNILDCFNNIDENIRFQNKKLELLKQQQKSMQQLLLTGIVRLKK